MGLQRFNQQGNGRCCDMAIRRLVAPVAFQRGILLLSEIEAEFSIARFLKRVSEKKRNKQRDCLHKASHLIAHKLVERTVVIGDLSQRQMVTKEHTEHLKALHRSVFNDWGLYGFVQMLAYKCVLAGKGLIEISERDTSKACSGCGEKQDMPLWKRTYRCETCGLVMDRDENSAVNILQRSLARLGPHTADAVRCIAGEPGGVAVTEAAQVTHVRESTRLNTF